MNSPIPIDRNEILKRYKTIDKFTHKGIQGHALLIGGSYGKIGAICLAFESSTENGLWIGNYFCTAMWLRNCTNLNSRSDGGDG